MRYAVVNNGTVINVIIWDGVTAYDPGPGNTLVRSDTLQIGDNYP